MHTTKNDISPAKRKKITQELNQLLSDAIDLKTQTKQAHWNVKGDGFIALHELFDKVATEVEEVVDLLAERVVQLGDTALGTARVAAKNSRLKEYPLAATTATQHVDALSTAIATFNRNARAEIDATDELGDAVTADILTGIVRGLDKLLWFVEAHLTETARATQKKAG